MPPPTALLPKLLGLLAPPLLMLILQRVPSVPSCPPACLMTTVGISLPACSQPKLGSQGRHPSCTQGGLPGVSGSPPPESEQELPDC